MAWCERQEESWRCKWGLDMPLQWSKNLLLGPTFKGSISSQ
jgi:hypothetical protein